VTQSSEVSFKSEDDDESDRDDDSVNSSESNDARDHEFDIEPATDEVTDMISIITDGKRKKAEDIDFGLGPFPSWSEFALAQFVDSTGLSRREAKHLFDLLHVCIHR
jgi:hypothetical protein